MNSVKEQNLAEIRKGNIEYQSFIKQKIELNETIELRNNTLMQVRDKTKFVRSEYVARFGLRRTQALFTL